MKKKLIKFLYTEIYILFLYFRVQEAVESATLPKQLTDEIESKLRLLFENKINETKFAVRSSATGMFLAYFLCVELWLLYGFGVSCLKSQK